MRPGVDGPTPAPLTARSVAGALQVTSAAHADPTCEKGTDTYGDTNELEC